MTDELESPAAPAATGIPVILKWSKRIYDRHDDESSSPLRIVPGSSTSTFQLQVQSLTGVPIARQKLLCKHGWKGTLKPDTTFNPDLSPPPDQDALTVTLIGSADRIPEPPKVRTKFEEDITPEERATAKAQRDGKAMEDAEGMIVALQFPPGEEDYRNDGKMEKYQYNRMVTGLPQLEIEELLRKRRKLREEADEGEGSKEEGSSNDRLLGKVAMTMGLELRRAYVNALAVLHDGTLVSASDDGHVQMWRHGELADDVIHEGMVEGGGVDCLVPFPDTNPRGGGGGGVEIATGGRGCVRLWTSDGKCVGSLPSPPGTGPSSLVAIPFKGKPAAAAASSGGAGGGTTSTSICLAASFKVIRQSDPNQFRLVPQDEGQRRRRVEAQAHEETVRRSLRRVSCCVRVWFSAAPTAAAAEAGATELRSVLLEPNDGGGTRAAAVTALAVLPGDDKGGGAAVLVCGDEVGGLRLWKSRQSGGDVQWEQQKLLQMRPGTAATAATNDAVSVVCMEPLPDLGLLAVSMRRRRNDSVQQDPSPLLLPGSIGIDAPFTDAVYIVDTTMDVVKLVLNAHRDAVLCMCSLPNGGLVTGGGKMDATLKVWDRSQLQLCSAAAAESGGRQSGSNSIDDGARHIEEGAQRVLSESAAELDEVGYVFALTVLPDSKAGSEHYALAAARYNVVKICL